MKKIIIAIIVSQLFFVQAKACDICGCGVGGYYVGILPEFHKTIMGLRYRYSGLRTHIGAGGTTTYLTTDETYNTIELWGGWNIGKKFRVLTTVPFNINERRNQSTTSSKQGIGDISVTGFYQLINARKAVLKDKLLIQSLWVGIGIKAPTGKYNPSDKGNASENVNLFQLGTGSVDLSLNAMYDIRLQDVGMNISASYKMNTTNKYKYSYGNKLTTNAQAYYKFRIKNKFTLAPNAGILFEHSAKDIDNKYAVDYSGGNILSGAIGLETNFKKISVGGNWQTPLSQNMANGFVKANNRMMLHVSFVL